MPATFILTTPDKELAAMWARQLPALPQVILDSDSLMIELQRPGARVWIKDLCDDRAQFSTHVDTVVISVGEPQSVPFEEAKLGQKAAFCLSYEESRKNLGRLTPLAAELAEKRAILAVIEERPRRSESQSASPFEPARRSLDELEFVEAAIDHLEDQSRLIEVLKRGFRTRLRASRVSIFLREGTHFRAGDEGWSCGRIDPLVFWLQEHAGIVDAETVENVENPSLVALLRQRMSEWNARLILPLEVHGALGGWVVFGPRADGRPYSQVDREDALLLVSLMARFLGQHKILHAALSAQEDLKLLDRHGPKFRIVQGDETMAESLPVEAREVLGIARSRGQRVEREFGQMRVSAAPIPETKGFWVLWDEFGSTAESVAKKLENERYQILHDLGIIISHELANALFSVSTYFQHIRKIPSEAGAAHPLLARVDEDMERLKNMPHILGTLYEMSQRPTTQVDMKRVIHAVAKEVDGTADVSESTPVLWGHEDNLRGALVWLCQEIKATRDPMEDGGRDAKLKISLQQRHRDGSDLICLVSIAYPGLRLDQLKVGEAKNVDEYPTVPIYLAREVIRFHYGTIHVGQGLDGPELNVALKSRRVIPAELHKTSGRFRRGHAGELTDSGADQLGKNGPDTLPASA
jgi:hypothetical protein